MSDVMPFEDYEALEELDELLLSLRVQARMKDGVTPIPVEAIVARYEQMHGLDLDLESKVSCRAWEPGLLDPTTYGSSPAKRH
jgi:hypothetical protein